MDKKIFAPASRALCMASFPFSARVPAKTKAFWWLWPCDLIVENLPPWFLQLPFLFMERSLIFSSSRQTFRLIALPLKIWSVLFTLVSRYMTPSPAFLQGNPSGVRYVQICCMQDQWKQFHLELSFSRYVFKTYMYFIFVLLPLPSDKCCIAYTEIIITRRQR